MKKVFNAVKVWSIKHTFHFIATISISLLVAANITQYGLLFDMKHKFNDQLSAQNKELRGWVDAKEVVLQKGIMTNEEVALNNYDSTNARIDNLDNTVKYDDKRRTLIFRIRKAITENTNTKLTTRDQNNISNAVIDYSYEWDLTIPQVLAQMKAESNFALKALSPVGAQGLMQIMPRTLKYIQYEMPNAPARISAWNVHHNIRAGCYYMAQQKHHFGSYEDALRAYNWGPDRLDKFNAGLISSMPQETQEYVPKILRYIEVFKKYGLDSL